MSPAEGPWRETVFYDIILLYCITSLQRAAIFYFLFFLWGFPFRKTKTDVSSAFLWRGPWMLCLSSVRYKSLHSLCEVEPPLCKEPASDHRKALWKGHLHCVSKDTHCLLVLYVSPQRSKLFFYVTKCVSISVWLNYFEGKLFKTLLDLQTWSTFLKKEEKKTLDVSLLVNNIVTTLMTTSGGCAVDHPTDTVSQREVFFRHEVSQRPQSNIFMYNKLPQTWQALVESEWRSDTLKMQNCSFVQNKDDWLFPRLQFVQLVSFSHSR